MFRFVQFPIPAIWTSHWPYRFDLTYQGPNEMAARQSPLTLYARLDFIDRACFWCEREIGQGGKESSTWFYAEQPAMIFINRDEHAFAFKMMFG